MKLLKSVPDNSILEIDATASSFIDSDVVAAIRNFGASAKLRDIQFVFRENQNSNVLANYSQMELKMEFSE